MFKYYISEVEGERGSGPSLILLMQGEGVRILKNVLMKYLNAPILIDLHGPFPQEKSFLGPLAAGNNTIEKP